MYAMVARLAKLANLPFIDSLPASFAVIYTAKEAGIPFLGFEQVWLPVWMVLMSLTFHTILAIL